MCVHLVHTYGQQDGVLAELLMQGSAACAYAWCIRTTRWRACRALDARLSCVCVLVVHTGSKMACLLAEPMMQGSAACVYMRIPGSYGQQDGVLAELLMQHSAASSSYGQQGGVLAQLFMQGSAACVYAWFIRAARWRACRALDAWLSCVCVYLVHTGSKMACLQSS